MRQNPAVRPAKTSLGPWDAFGDVDVFVDEVLAELTAIARDGTWPRRPGAQGRRWPGDAAQGGDGDLVCLFLRYAVAGHRTALRSLLQHRPMDYSPVGPGSVLWRRLLDWLRRTWRRACGDTPELSVVVIDGHSRRSAPSWFARGIDGGKKIHGVKIQMAVEKYGIPLAIDVAPANWHDTKAIVPVLRELADGGFQGLALGDLEANGANRWPRPVRHSASPSRRSLAAETDSSFPPASAGWLNGPLPG